MSPRHAVPNVRGQYSYPADAAPTGHIALLALCPRRITDAEITNMQLPTREQIALVRQRVNAGVG